MHAIAELNSFLPANQPFTSVVLMVNSFDVTAKKRPYRSLLTLDTPATPIALFILLMPCYHHSC